ncbi:DUF2933 domain-containing protein [Aquabacterium sp.]|uniref:DUF2933 domain-containing protein n=1 Tax=Aquabacterium sp. TaxID=1872578 RepID=UPI0040382C74
MDHQHEHGKGPEGSTSSFFKSPIGVAIAMLALIAAFYVLREHWQHVAGSWPYLLLLACPLMHVFHGHGGHGGHHHHGPSTPPSDPNKKNW